jgi:hypothetical protein
MISRISIGFAALGCVLLASCYPYDEHAAHRKTATPKPADKTITSAEQQKLKEQREQLKQQEELKKTQEQTATTPAQENTTSPSIPSNEAPKPPAEPKRDFAFANKVPGKDGFVFSPYNNKVVDVRDIPSGTLVQDPTYPPADKKYFRVP